MMAALVGAAVIVAPGGPTPGRGPGWRPPAYVRALRWRDIIRMRLSPWLLSGFFSPPQGAMHPGAPRLEFRPPDAAPSDAKPPSGVPPESRPEPPDESRSS